MRWEDQELNHQIPAEKFPEVSFAGLFLLDYASKRLGSFLRMDQQVLIRMIKSGELPEMAAGTRIDRLCLYYRLFCGLGPGGNPYPALGTTHFWKDSKSHYAILHISPKNDWFDIMAVQGEAPK